MAHLRLPSVIRSTELSLLQFTLGCQPQQVTNCENPKDRKNEPTHILIHVDGTSASSSPPDDGAADTPASLEVVSISLLIDKFPMENIPNHNSAKDGIYLIKFWADLSYETDSPGKTDFFHVTTMYESSKLMSVSCKTIVCSFGRSIGEKVDKLEAVQLEPNRVVYQNIRAPLCDYLVNFIQKLKSCEEVSTMNGVLENFSVLQVISNDATQEMLLSFAYVFEVCPPELSATTGAMCKVYRLDSTTTSTVDK